MADILTADGEQLAVTVVSETQDRPLPTVLIRTPYGRENLLPEARSWARRGFACVVGDVRGRFASTGEFLPYEHEYVDGGRVLDWVREQSFCDGRVIVAGASYGAFCAIATAVARPNGVKGVLAAVPALGLGETAREPGGAVRLACRVGWWSEHGGVHRPRTGLRWDDALLRGLPVRDLPALVLGASPAGWSALWTAPERSAVWQQVHRLRMPLLAVGGLADPFAAHTAELADAWGGPTRLVLGPWGHELDSGRPGAALGGARIGALYLGWARHVIRGQARYRRAVLAVGESGQWRRLNTVDGAQVTVLPLTGAPAGFVADPDGPFQSEPLGGTLNIDRSRCAVLHSPAVGPAEIRGRLTLRLRASADTSDADWVVRVSVDGVQLTHAIRRFSGLRAEPTRIALTTPPVGAVLRAGARLVVEIAGHHWPRYARNPHTGEDAVTATALQPSRRRVLGADLEVPLHTVATDAVAPEKIIEEAAW
ncbi:CocE/NonD family hydrolase [Saccharomonospora sp. NPDC046836]|uniref:CocE/NonD family hydrolase n=1 Tax=Saccharomonospora sp. NPDC046836 TaxID=3156921 RepID=UPI00340582F2